MSVDHSINLAVARADNLFVCYNAVIGVYMDRIDEQRDIALRQLEGETGDAIIDLMLNAVGGTVLPVGIANAIRSNSRKVVEGKDLSIYSESSTWNSIIFGRTFKDWLDNKS